MKCVSCTRKFHSIYSLSENLPRDRVCSSKFFFFLHHLKSVEHMHIISSAHRYGIYANQDERSGVEAKALKEGMEEIRCARVDVIAGGGGFYHQQYKTLKWYGIPGVSTEHVERNEQRIMVARHQYSKFSPVKFRQRKREPAMEKKRFVHMKRKHTNLRATKE